VASITTPAGVASAIARALGVPTSAQQSDIESVSNAIRDAHLLLILDNFEQALDAVTVIADVLAKCRSTTILVTSRTLLRISGEQVFAVPLLKLPASDVALKELRSSASVQLFGETVDSPRLSSLRLVALDPSSLYPVENQSRYQMRT
jgi:predicted ATPase